MWIYFTVTDAKGAVVYRSGAVKDGKTEPGTEDFKVHLGDKDGNTVDTEIWLVTSVLADTRVLPNGYDIRTFHFPVPLKAEGPFKLEAKLNYWPFSQALADQLLGAGKMPTEIVTIASADTNVAVAKVGRGREARPTPPGAAPSPRPIQPRAAVLIPPAAATARRRPEGNP